MPDVIGSGWLIRGRPITVTADDLSAPLGQETTQRKRRRLPFTGIQIMASLLGLFLAAFIGFALFHLIDVGRRNDRESMARTLDDETSLADVRWARIAADVVRREQGARQ